MDGADDVTETVCVVPNGEAVRPCQWLEVAAGLESHFSSCAAMKDLSESVMDVKTVGHQRQRASGVSGWTGTGTKDAGG